MINNFSGDILDGLIVASNHFHEEMNLTKVFKDKRIMLLTDFSSSIDDDDKLSTITKGLSKHSIRVDVISPFSESENDEKAPTSSKDNSTDHKAASNGKASRNLDADEAKTMTREQKANCTILRQICEETDGAMYSFDEGNFTILNPKKSHFELDRSSNHIIESGGQHIIPGHIIFSDFSMEKF